MAYVKIKTKSKYNYNELYLIHALQQLFTHARTVPKNTFTQKANEILLYAAT